MESRGPMSPWQGSMYLPSRFYIIFRKIEEVSNWYIYQPNSQSSIDARTRCVERCLKLSSNNNGMIIWLRSFVFPSKGCNMWCHYFSSNVRSYTFSLWKTNKLMSTEQTETDVLFGGIWRRLYTLWTQRTRRTLCLQTLFFGISVISLMF